LGDFSHEKILCMGSKSYFSSKNSAKKSPVKETNVFLGGQFLYHGKSKKGLANGIERFGIQIMFKSSSGDILVGFMSQCPNKQSRYNDVHPYFSRLSVGCQRIMWVMYLFATQCTSSSPPLPTIM
jgi:hypothetical protein